MDGSCPYVVWDCCIQKPHSSLHKHKNHFSLEPNEIIITGTTGIIAASYYYATPLKRMILFWLFFFLPSRWQIVLIIHSHSETSLTSTSYLLEDHQAENMFIQLSMIINCVFLIMQQFTTQSNIYPITVVTVISVYISIGYLLRTHVLLYTMLTTKEKSTLQVYAAFLHPAQCKMFLLSEQNISFPLFFFSPANSNNYECIPLVLII